MKLHCSFSVPAPSASKSCHLKLAILSWKMEAKEGVDPQSGGDDKKTPQPQPPPQASIETDDFGLPIRRYPTPPSEPEVVRRPQRTDGDTSTATAVDEKQAGGVKETSQHTPDQVPEKDSDEHPQRNDTAKTPKYVQSESSPTSEVTPSAETMVSHDSGATGPPASQNDKTEVVKSNTLPESETKQSIEGPIGEPESQQQPTRTAPPSRGHRQQASLASLSTEPNEGGVSDFSHQKLSTQPDTDGKDGDGDEGWQEMPSYARYDMYDDDDRLIAREHDVDEDEKYAYGGLGGAGKGYTRVQMDDDAQSATSMDDNTRYLFKESKGGTAMVDEEEDDTRDAMSQMQATKDLLTEGQRIAYVGVVRLEVSALTAESDKLEAPKKIKKEVSTAAEAMKMWSQKIMIRLYAHMDISEAEQVMIEQLAEHGVVPADLTPALYANARVKNPMAEKQTEDKNSEADPASPPAYPDEEKSSSPLPHSEDKSVLRNGTTTSEPTSAVDDEKVPTPDPEFDQEKPVEPPPPYEMNDTDTVPEAQMPSQLPTTDKIDIDLRWTVLCDLFLVLILDSVYDARSRVLLERVAKSLDIPWADICRFEKRVTDALEMQQAAEKENWNEDEHMESRRKRALKKRYVMMGLATVGGGLVIGLSAGLLAPVIGAGLAAGFTTIGVAGTSGFLGGVGGAAIITSGAVASGSYIGVKAAHKRTGAVKTFEYRPLHNNKRVHLIVTVSGWLTGNVDDVRLPFSTVDPTMGDIYSVLWEPDLLKSTGDTIRILATEALTQSIQQILASTILATLMGALQLPIILTKLAYLIDNPWAVSLDRATQAGKILADSLIERNLGTRPITLVGYSLGARVIFSCLHELAKRGAYGLIQNVYMFGSPIVVKKEEYLMARTVVPGRFVNGYNRTDWILGYLFRLTNGGLRRVAGLAPIDDLPWIENFDCTEFVVGHMEYRTAMPTLLMNCGWMVESEEFTEIEDPDPDNHTERQRELISEIEQARRDLEKEGTTKKSSRFSLFGRKKRAERREWELYEEKGNASTGDEAKTKQTDVRDSDDDSAYRGALFDVDAIRAELAKEAKEGRMEEEIQIREIKSTLPPMKLDLSPTPSGGLGSHGSLPESRSAEHIPARHPAADDEIHMSFDTDYDHAPRPPPKDGSSADRPAIKQSQTLPNIQLHDPWGDPDDDDFGKEKEISLTFA